MKSLPLDQLQIPAPCPQSWDAMTGNHARRFCNQCQKHVHDLSTLPRHQANALLQTHSHICVQIQRNPAGRILTAEDFPHPRLTRLKSNLRRFLPPFLLAVLPFLHSACTTGQPLPQRTAGVPTLPTTTQPATTESPTHTP